MRKFKILVSHYAIIDKEGFGRTFMLAKELAFNGNQVTLITDLPANSFIFPYKKELRDGVEIFAFPDIIPDSFRRIGFGILALILKSIFVLTHRFDIVHGDNGHRPSSGFPCKLNRLFYKSIYVTEWWDFFGRGGQYNDLKGIKKYTKGIYDLLTEVQDKKKANFVVVLSQSMKVRAEKAGIPSEKLEIIHGGCDTRSITYIDNTHKKSEYNINPDAITFGFIGMNEGEFFDIVPFIKAINQVKHSLKVNWFTTGRKLSEKIKSEHNIGQELIEFGWVDYNRYSDIISCADVFVLTQCDNLCNQTRWPNKIGDYLAAGRIILTNPVGDIRYLAEKYPESIISCNFTESSIVEQIKKINHRRKEIINIGKMNRMIAENELSWNHKAIQLENIYNRVSLKIHD